MGFNFSVRKLVDGELTFESGDYGIDTVRASGDEQFYYALLNSEDGYTADILSDMSEDCAFVRPADFAQARTTVERITAGLAPGNRKRLLAILDKLEADPSLWLGGSR